MKENKSKYATIKCIILVILSVSIGSFMANILEKTQLNIWMGRIIGCLVTVIIAGVLYYLWLRKTGKSE